jgi:HSP20 family protein
MKCVITIRRYKDMFESDNRGNVLAQWMDRKADFYHNLGAAMRSNVEELDDHYELKVEMPGCRKEDIQIRLENGYLVITAKRNANHNNHGSYIMREIVEGRFQRSYYIGDDIKESEIHAKFENGILTISVPKKDQDVTVEEDHSIQIN